MGWGPDGAETLNECLAGVELVIAHFKENYRAMSGGTA